MSSKHQNRAAKPQTHSCRLAALMVASLLTLAAFSPVGASAARLHAFSSSFGGPGSGPGELELAFPQLAGNNLPLTAGSGVAVNAATGDVYVADTGNHRVDQFANGSFVRAFGADVGGPGIDVCTTTCTAGGSGHLPGELETPTFIAVDNDLASASHGDVYVVDTAAQLVSKFAPDGTLEAAWGAGGQLNGSAAPGGPFSKIVGIAVDPAGNLWVQDGDEMDEFNQAGTLVQTWHSPLGTQPTGIAVDGAGHLYTLDGFPEGPITRFTIAGSKEAAVYKAPEGGFISNIAVSQADDVLYAGVEGTLISAFSPGCEPVLGRCRPIETFGEGELARAAGIAVDSADNTLYAAETAGNEIEAFTVSLEASVVPATEIEATTATAHGSIDPKGSQVTGCVFQFGATTSYGAETPCLNPAGEEVGTDANPITAPTQVHGSLTGLASGSVTHFRLRVKNQRPEFLSSEDAELTTKVLATIEAASASEITATSATLQATVNPHGLAVSSCVFEYGADLSYGTTVPCQPPSLPAGTAPVPVAAQLTGLSPDTTYHFRVTLADANGTFQSADHTFVFLTGSAVEGGCANEVLRAENGSLLLPDCRAYELVTPLKKNGALIAALLFNNIPPAVAEDGESVTAPSIQCFAQSTSCVATRLTEGEPFEFTRTPSGWTARSLALPATTFPTSGAWRFSPNTGAALFDAPVAGGGDQWYARASDGTVSALGPIWEGEESPERSLRTLEPEPTIVTADLSHLVYESEGPLWNFDHSESAAQGLYEYPNPNGAGPQLVAVSGGAGSTELIGVCGSVLGGRVARYNQAYGTLSADGSTVYFETVPCAHGSGNNTAEVPVRELFVRIDGERTVAISEPEALSPAPANPSCSSTECQANTTNPQRFRQALFEGAAADGSRAYFTSPQQLTDSASQDPNSNDGAGVHCPASVGAHGCNLYLYEDPKHPLSGIHLFDASAGDSSGLGPEVQGVMAISGDGTHAYFVAKGVLTEAPNAAGAEASEGAENLYLYQHDAAHPQGETTFIATLSSADADEWRGGIGYANVTPDGRYLVFRSHRGLNSDTAAEGAGQIYRYDAQTGSLQRISFGQDGFNDDGNAGHASANIAIVAKTLLQHVAPTRPDPTMSDDGSRIFFISPVALTPTALDEAPVEGEPAKLATNVYEWESDGSGSCTEARGCVWLISDGKDRSGNSKVLEAGVELLGSDPSGENVFLATADRLTWQDTDSQRDYYDVRVRGGFVEPAAAAICQGDGCKAAGTQASVGSSPATSTFNGPGNVRSKACSKHSRHCKAKQKHRKHHKRHHSHQQRKHRRVHRNQGGRK